MKWVYVGSRDAVNVYSQIVKIKGRDGRTRDVMAAYNGTIVSVLVQIGQEVEEGETILYEIRRTESQPQPSNKIERQSSKQIKGQSSNQIKGQPSNQIKSQPSDQIEGKSSKKIEVQSSKRKQKSIK